MLWRSFLLALARKHPLAAVYGKELSDVGYVQTMALIGRLQVGGLTDVERLVAAFVNGQQNSLAKLTLSHLSGHLVFDELNRRTAKAVYRDRMIAAAGGGD